MTDKNSKASLLKRLESARDFYRWKDSEKEKPIYDMKIEVDAPDQQPRVVRYCVKDGTFQDPYKNKKIKLTGFWRMYEGPEDKYIRKIFWENVK
jgi:hypothetical protein